MNCHSILSRLDLLESRLDYRVSYLVDLELFSKVLLWSVEPHSETSASKLGLVITLKEVTVD